MKNYGEIKSAILNEVLKDKNSKELSATLGFKFNKVDRWKSGQKQCRWSEFWDLCIFLEIPIQNALKSVFAIEPSFIEEPSQVLRAIKSFYPTEISIHDLAINLNCHSSALKRYLRGDTSCDLEIVLSLMDFQEDYLDRFVQRLLKKSLSSLLNIESFGDSLLHPLIEDPLNSSVSSALEIDDYKKNKKHNDEFISTKVGTHINRVKKIISSLTHQGKIKIEDGKYLPLVKTFQLEGMDSKSILALVRYWSYRAYLRLSGESQSACNIGPNPNYAMVRIVAMSDEGVKRLAEQQMKSYREMCSIVDNDNELKSEVRVILMHSFGAHEIPEKFEEPPIL